MAEVLEVPTHGSGAVLAATKLHIPGIRPELVARQALVEELVAAGSRKLTLIEAPAGYGKTTLLAEWCSSAAETREFAWLSLDEGDGDPVRFWMGVIDALRGLEPHVGEAARGALEAPSVDLVEVALPLLLNELVGLRRRIVLVLDDYQAVREEVVHRSVEFLLDHLPEGLQLALATRADPPLSLARLRAAGELTEIRAADLRFDDREAAQLLRRTVGLDLADPDVARLRERTEGWPAGLYLAGLSLRGRADPGEFIESFAGDDRHIVDYLSSEVLAHQPDELRAFLLRTSALDRLCGPLCDAVAETEDSGQLLAAIERRNLFLIPLDTTRTWYRYHRLFRELLRHELDLSAPEDVPGLHRRACDWYREEGSIPEAIHHATAGEDVEAARELIALHWNDYFNQGRLATVEGWLEAIPRPSVRDDPRLCVAGAWLALDRGGLDDAREWIESAARARAGAEESDADLIAAEVEVLRAVHGFKAGELETASSAALEALQLAEQGSFPDTVAQMILGVTLYWGGALDEAANVLEQAARRAETAGNDLGQSYALGYLGLAEADRGRIEEADRLGWKAVSLSDAPGFAEHFVLMVGHLARGRAAELTGRIDDAERMIRRAVELSDRGAGRLELAASLLALAPVQHLQGDLEAARASLLRARAILDQCADPGTLGRALSAAERSLRAAPRGVALRSSEPADELTDRELAVLRLLASDLSRREIAEALYVSPNTVKTHVKGIYRKLDASTREDAVGRARELGLL